MLNRLRKLIAQHQPSCVRPFIIDSRCEVTDDEYDALLRATITFADSQNVRHRVAVMCGYHWRDRYNEHDCYLPPGHPTIHVCTCGARWSE